MKIILINSENEAPVVIEGKKYILLLEGKDSYHSNMSKEEAIALMAKNSFLTILDSTLGDFIARHVDKLKPSTPEDSD